MMIRRLATLVVLGAFVPPALAETDVTLAPASARFAAAAVEEVPDFQRHVLPMMGRVGCNTRSCHGSFQGAGGLRLSLFGYDFKADRDTLFKEGTGRVDLTDPEGSKILAKPTLAIPHKGGKRFEADGWQYRLIARWIEGGAKGVDVDKSARFERLEVDPAEIVFREAGQKVPLRVVAHWSDGGAEDVTCLTRFRTNDEAIATVDDAGVITSVGPGDTHVVAFYDNGVHAVPVLQPVSTRTGASYPEVPTPTKVDELVVAKLRKLGITPSPTCTDAEYLRRLSLDLTGTLPTPVEIEAFLSDPSPEKRALKVDELLARPSYAAWWTTKLCDLTGNSPKLFNAQQFGNQVSRQWYDWMYKRVAENMPYDQIAAGLVLATSRAKGESYDDFARFMAAANKPGQAEMYADRETLPYFWARNNFRKPEERVIGFSYAFLGVRLECAQCHKHPFDQWTQDDFNRFGDFFNAVGFGTAPESRPSFQKLNQETGLDKLQGGERNKKLAQLRQAGEVIPCQEVFVNRNGQAAKVKAKGKQEPTKAGRVVSAKVLGGDEVSIVGVDDPRAPLMEWLRSKDNPYFAKAFVNRVWANDFGIGIVTPTDDMNLANPPSNAALLQALADGFVDHNFDMKWLHREIVTSLAYQRSWQSNETNKLDERNFSRALIRRLPAEVLIDAVTLATANSKVLAKAATDVESRAIGAAGGATKRPGAGAYAAKVFGASTRETNCDCNRSDEPNLLQSIYLSNDAEVFVAIDRADGWLVEQAKVAPGGGGGQIDVAKFTAGLEKVSLEQLEARLADARANDQQPRILRLELRIAEVKGNEADLKEARAKVGAFARKAMARPKPTESAQTGTIDRPAIVREAYLRTLSRRPTEAEAEAANQHLADSTNLGKGLRDLLWALLNTKEFITNH